MKRILLVGNPNVGKSTLFSRLTGVNVDISNYAGTTVEYKKGFMTIDGKKAEIVDVPGVYSLSATSKAEEVATNMLEQGDIVINVVDATNLERNLLLTLQLLEKGVKVIVVLNFYNEIKKKGIEIDLKTLNRELGVPVIPIVAITGEGVKDVVDNLDKAKKKSYSYNDEKRWQRIGQIIENVQKIKQKDYSFVEKLENLTIYPLTGIPLAFGVMVLLFFLIRTIGEGMIQYIFEPLFGLYLPLVEWLSSFLGQSIIHDILIGQLIEGNIDFVQSMGLLTTGLFVPIVMVFPYVLTFYFMLGILEDTGYLPRLSILIDSFMHKIRLHGLAIIPMMLGAGCNVPGVLGTRILETKRQRFIVITLLSISIPCMAQTAMIYGLLGQYGIKALVIVFMTLAVVWTLLGIILNKIIKGHMPETFIEITPYRIPNFKILGKKLFWRMKSFMKEAIPFMLLGVLIVNVLYLFNIMDYLAGFFAPFVSGILGLPKEAIASLLIGFLRKDLAVGTLIPLGLSMNQLIISCVVLTMYFPCIATFVIIFKELGLKDTIKSSLIMIVSSFAVGGLLNIILN